MSYFKLILPKENSWEVLSELGLINSIQFIDEEPNLAAFAKPFAQQIRRCDELETKITNIIKEMDHFKKYPL